MPSERCSVRYVQSFDVDPSLHIAHKSAQFHKILILKLEETIKKISYGRRDYESVDEESVSEATSRKTTNKKNEFRQQKVRENQNLQIYLTLYCLECTKVLELPKF